MSLLLFWIGSQIQFSKAIINHFLHNLLVLFFVGFAFVLEKNNLRSSNAH
jgi:hypothetical protein